MKNFQDFPLIVHERILSYTSFHEVSKLRLTSRRMNTLCIYVLRSGFNAAERLHASLSKMIRAQLPRRESQRRGHPLSRHSEILASIETRLSLLNMTFMKFVQSGRCNFIPGKVIDELMRVLRIVGQEKINIPKPFDLLQELRDISSMSMEYFDEQILPSLEAPLSTASVCESLQICRKANSKSKGVKRCNKRISELSSHLSEYKRIISDQSYQIKALEVVISKQNELLKQHASGLKEINQKMAETDQVMLDLRLSRKRKADEDDSLEGEEDGGQCSSSGEGPPPKKMAL
eukprot:TRINITY_DN3673_c0_g1_i2.p1 TRINITY_DN3673_c0_g1~~TRINITY_DN3673_c0_g1_i2.p1  ORF type:complete len:290 (-),score=84.78 TRINITY_DN3673_c0_g1_i2:1139-2008(-)